MGQWRWLIGPILGGLLLGLLLTGLLSQRPDPETLIADAVADAAPSVANIYTTKRLKQSRRHPLLDDPFFGRLFPRQQRERREASLGSAVVVSRDGLLLTNYHVIQDAEEILVLLQDGRQAAGTVLGVDPDSDLAVLQIAMEGLQPIALGDPGSARVGQTVLAIGNPWGFGQSVSRGIISATHRYGLGLSAFEDFLQTDAAINPGNSGGALIDTRGRLLGINTAIYTPTGGSSGIGLAIPADMAIQIMNDLLEYGRPMRGWLGIEARASRLGEIIVTGLYPNGPAASAGVMAGDHIISINDRMLADAQDGMRLIGRTRPGDVIQLGIQRGEQSLEFPITVAERPQISPR